LISFNYNLKPQRMPNGEMKPAGQMLIETSGSPDEIRDRMVQYNKAGGQTLPALVERRQDEATLFNGGTPPIGPDRAPGGAASTTTPPETTRALGRMAGISKAPEEFSPKQHAYDSAEATKANALIALEGLRGTLQGASAALSKYVNKPIFGGVQNAIYALAPDSELSKYTAGLYGDFNKFAVEKTGKAALEKMTPKEGESTMGQISRMIGIAAGDLLTVGLTAGAGTGLRAVVGVAEAAP